MARPIVSGGFHEHGKLRVLVVEGDPSLSLLAANYLARSERADLEYAVCTTPGEAIDFCRKLPKNNSDLVVLTDYRFGQNFGESGPEEATGMTGVNMLFQLKGILGTAFKAIICTSNGAAAQSELVNPRSWLTIVEKDIFNSKQSFLAVVDALLVDYFLPARTQSANLEVQDPF